MDNILELVDLIAKERNIEKEKVYEYLELALKASVKKQFKDVKEVRVDLCKDEGKLDIYIEKVIVEEVLDNVNEISLTEAKSFDKSLNIDDIYLEKVDPLDFGRNSARVAAQSIYQNILIAERQSTYNYFKEKEKELINGVIQRVYKNDVYVNLGKIDGILKPNDRIDTEEYIQSKRIRCFIKEVVETNTEPVVLLSRNHPDLIKRLFEMEVPEIYEGDLIIKNIAREAGSRTKIAVYTENDKLDPVGTCVGPNGARVEAVVNEINGEKIDIVEYDKDPIVFIENALKPAKVITIKEIEPQSALAIVPDYQLSLAIGKKGQNARLAAKLTGWKIDIKSESEVENGDGEKEATT